MSSLTFHGAFSKRVRRWLTDPQPPKAENPVYRRQSANFGGNLECTCSCEKSLRVTPLTLQAQK